MKHPDSAYRALNEGLVDLANARISHTMMKIEVESLSTTSNAAVIRLPARKFPGIVIQGDSLKILVDLVDDLRPQSQGQNVSELGQILNGYRTAYEQALRENNFPLPY